MSHSDTERLASTAGSDAGRHASFAGSDSDRRAAAAVIEHHAQLAEALAEHAERLRAAAAAGSPMLVAVHRDALLAWLRTELVPHARAEEVVLYPAAADQPAGRLLVNGMVAEHQAIMALVDELADAVTGPDAMAATRALTALFAVHLQKENELILPLLLASEDSSVAELLDGMHDLIGASGAVPAGGGCGSGGACGCGGDARGSAAEAPLLSVDTRLDVRQLAHDERHPRVLAALDALPADGALVLIAPHAPRPLLAEIDTRYRGQIAAEWLQDGPDVWQIRLHRRPATV